MPELLHCRVYIHTMVHGHIHCFTVSCAIAYIAFMLYSTLI